LAGFSFPTMKVKRSLLCLLTIYLLAVPLQAQLIQAVPFSFDGTNLLTKTISFNPWTNSLIPLTSVTLKINGFVSGSFFFTGSSYTVDAPQLFQSYSFTSGNTNGVPPDSIFSSPLQTMPTTPTTPGAFSGVQPFTIDPTTQIGLAGDYDLTAYKDYFYSPNLIGTNLITMNIASLLFVNTTGNPLALGNTLNVAGSVTLEMIPEPSTYALLSLSALSFGYMVRKRRRA